MRFLASLILARVLADAGCDIADVDVRCAALPLRRAVHADCIHEALQIDRAEKPRRLAEDPLGQGHEACAAGGGIGLSDDDTAAGPHNARHLAGRLLALVEMMEGVADEDGVEPAVVERYRRGDADYRLHAGKPLGVTQHARARVQDSHDAWSSAGE